MTDDAPEVEEAPANAGLGQWFVIQTLSGQEMKAQQSIERRCKLEGMEDDIYEVLVPTEKVADTRRGRRTVTSRKFFPGYILVRLKLYESDGTLNSRAWYFIRDSQGVIGFIGGGRPAALTDDEVTSILAQTKDDEEAPRPKITFEMGESVVIKDGAFENFEGVIESVDPERGKLKLSVSIFGRSTPVEVEYWQVERG